MQSYMMPKISLLLPIAAVMLILSGCGGGGSGSGPQATMDDGNTGRQTNTGNGNKEPAAETPWRQWDTGRQLARINEISNMAIMGVPIATGPQRGHQINTIQFIDNSRYRVTSAGIVTGRPHDVLNVGGLGFGEEQYDNGHGFDNPHLHVGHMPTGINPNSGETGKNWIRYSTKQKPYSGGPIAHAINTLSNRGDRDLELIPSDVNYLGLAYWLDYSAMGAHFENGEYLNPTNARIFTEYRQGTDGQYYATGPCTDGQHAFTTEPTCNKFLHSAAVGWVTGQRSTTRPLSGTATYEGFATGFVGYNGRFTASGGTLGGAAGFTADATAMVNFDNADMALTLDNFTGTGHNLRRRVIDNWTIQPDGTIDQGVPVGGPVGNDAAFYGPDAKEVAGVFAYSEGGRDVTGSFAARRGN